jgi:DNA-directed RNA polymerase alpha subunit
MNYQYLIPQQLKSLSDRDAKILHLLGIDFAIFQPSSEQRDILICEVNFPVRAANVLKTVLEDRDDWNTMKISEFVGEYSERELLRYRNCGTKTLREINNTLYPYGFTLTKGR